MYSHGVEPEPGQGLGPEQWGTIRLGPYPGSGVMCESVHTVSYNPFVPDPCPGLSSCQCEYAIVEDRGRLRDSLAASLNLKMCLYQAKATLLQTKYNVLVLIFLIR